MTSTPDQQAPKPLRVAMIGHAFMGAAHSHAWRTAPRFFDLPLAPQLSVLCGRNPETTAAAAGRLGWAEWSTDWREVVERDDIDLVDICTPGDTHAAIAIAALEAGKHVLCEKPLANSVAEAEQMAEAAAKAAARGVRSTVGFSYRRVPALALARDLVADGRLGRIYHVRAQYLQDWIVDPEFPLVWRLQKDKAGSGDRGAGTGEVTVDDAAIVLARTSGGALATFEATRFATGRKNAMRLELNGSKGSLAFDFEAMNELHVYDATVPATDAGFRRILVTEPEHPYTGAWWPAGHGLGYEHTFTHEVVDLVRDIAADRDPEPSFADGLAVQRILEAVEQSASSSSSWTPVPTSHK
jgi:predicted dehydrogenase